VVEAIAPGDRKTQGGVSMIGTHTTLSRLFRGIAIAASLVALAAPAALAGPRSDSTQFVTDTLAPGGDTVQTTGSRFVTDTLAPGGGTAETAGYRFVTDTLAPGGGLVTSSPAANGFDWSDAGIGAAITAGLMLILIGATRLLSNRRSAVAV
jgi:hypothetical protein